MPGGSAAKIGKVDHQGLDHFNQNAHVSTVKRECEGSDRFLKLSHRSYFEFQQMLNLMFELRTREAGGATVAVWNFAGCGSRLRTASSAARRRHCSAQAAASTATRTQASAPSIARCTEPARGALQKKWRNQVPLPSGRASCTADLKSKEG